MLKWIASSILLISTHNLLIAQFCINERFTQADYFTENEIIIQNDVSYGLADDWYLDIPQPLQNSFNIAYPNTSIDLLDKRPLVVLAHGGGFWGGEKESLDDIIQGLAKKGFVAVSLNYRKGWDAYGDPTGCDGDGESLNQAVYKSMQDVQACIRYLVFNAATYGIDTSWIFAGGESAGLYAILNSNYITQPEWNGLFPDYEFMFGPVMDAVNDINIDYSIKGFINMWGGVLDTGALTDNDIKPMISFYGTSDDVVPPYSGSFQNCENYAFIYGSASLNDYLDDHNVCNALHTRIGYGHDAYDHQYVTDNISCFMKSLFCNDCNNYEVNYELADCSAMQATDINDIALEITDIYPNPASEYVIINSAELNDQFQLILTNATGSSIRVDYTVNGSAINLNTKDLAGGIYFFTLIGKNFIKSGRFVIVE